MLEDGLAGDASGTYRVVRALHFGHVQEARCAADQTAARERELWNRLQVRNRHSLSETMCKSDHLDVNAERAELAAIAIERI